MKIENEIEKLTKRVNLLENQNIRFKSLLDSAIEITKQSVSRTQIQKDETEFLSETINLIEAEKTQLQDDLVSLKQSEKEDFMDHIRQLENENTDLKNKMKLLLQEAQNNAKDIKQLKLEHSEFKFLLTQPDSNTQWLKNILQLDNTVAENASMSLMEQRYELQQKIYKLERKKTELLSAIDDFTAPSNTRDTTYSKNDVENTLYSTIDDESKREYENLHLKVLELEQERSTLLSQLQLILERSRKEIADEYCQLQKKILEIETEKVELRHTLKNFVSERSPSEHTLIQSGDTIDVETVAEANENEVLEKILNAFTNTRSQVDLHQALRRDGSKSNIRKGTDYCIIS